MESVAALASIHPGLNPNHETTIDPATSDALQTRPSVEI
jgi:hypothetical protein